MNKIAIIGGALLIGSMAFGAWQTMRLQDLQAQIDTLQASHDRWNTENQQLSDQYNKTIAGLKQQVQDVQGRLELAQSQATASAPAANQAARLASTGNVAAPTIARNSRPNPMDSPDFRQVMMQQQVTSRFGAFIVGLHLSPEKEKALKNRLAAALMNGLELGRDLGKKVESGEITREEAAAQAKAANMTSETTRIMAEYLSTEQMDALRAYEADAPNRNKAQLANSMYMSMDQQTPGLTDANRTKVASALADAMLAPRAAPKAGQQSVTGMSQVYDQVETSLRDTMSDDQMRIVREFLRNRSSMETAILSNNANKK